MPSASKEIGAETALAREDRSVHIVETGGTGFAGGRKHTERDDGLFRIRGRQNDHPGTERRVRNHQRHWIYVERQIVELRIAFTVGEFVRIGVRKRLELTGKHPRVT